MIGNENGIEARSIKDMERADGRLSCMKGVFAELRTLGTKAQWSHGEKISAIVRGRKAPAGALSC